MKIAMNKVCKATKVLGNLHAGETFMIDGQVFICVSNVYPDVHMYNFNTECLEVATVDNISQKVQLVDCGLTVTPIYTTSDIE